MTIIQIVFISQFIQFFQFIGRTGIVAAMDQVRVVVEYQGDKFIKLNPQVLLRLSHICNEEPVWMRRDESAILGLKEKIKMAVN